jgi:hypothetical protein
MKRNWIRNIIRGLSFTSVLFVFQACYGSPQDMGDDVLIEGLVTSKTSGIGIKGIKVSVPDNTQYEFTDADGKFAFYTLMIGNLKILFEDVDSTQNGVFLNADTVLTNVAERITLNITLDEK